LQARGYAAEAMHGDMSQAQREALIKRLKNGKSKSSSRPTLRRAGSMSSASRSVINYDMPSDTESYVHRIGRTGAPDAKAKPFCSSRRASSE
jgi:ATP-dependent RNA helicase DeaD